MLRILLPVAFAAASTVAFAGDVPVLPPTTGTTPWVKSPTVWDFGGPREVAVNGSAGVPRADGGAGSPLRSQAARGDALMIVAGLNARDRARLAARIEAELANRTR